MNAETKTIKVRTHGPGVLTAADKINLAHHVMLREITGEKKLLQTDSVAVILEGIAAEQGRIHPAETETNAHGEQMKEETQIGLIVPGSRIGSKRAQISVQANQPVKEEKAQGEVRGMEGAKEASVMKAVMQRHVSKGKVGKDLQPNHALAQVEREDSLHYRVNAGTKALTKNLVHKIAGVDNSWIKEESRYLTW